MQNCAAKKGTVFTFNSKLMRPLPSPPASFSNMLAPEALGSTGSYIISIQPIVCANSSLEPDLGKK